MRTGLSLVSLSILFSRSYDSRERGDPRFQIFLCGRRVFQFLLGVCDVGVALSSR